MKKVIIIGIIVSLLILSSCSSEKGYGEDGPSYPSYQIGILNSGDYNIRAVISYDNKEIIETKHIEPSTGSDPTEYFTLFIPNDIDTFEVELTILNDENDILTESVNIRNVDSDFLLIKYDGSELTIKPVYEMAL